MEHIEQIGYQVECAQEMIQTVRNVVQILISKAMAIADETIERHILKAQNLMKKWRQRYGDLRSLSYISVAIITLAQRSFADISTSRDTWVDGVVFLAIMAYYFLRIPLLYVLYLSLVIWFKALIWRRSWQLSKTSADWTALGAGLLSAGATLIVACTLYGAVKIGGSLLLTVIEYVLGALLSSIVEYQFIIRTFIKRKENYSVAVPIISVNVVAFIFLAILNNLVFNHFLNYSH